METAPTEIVNRVQPYDLSEMTPEQQAIMENIQSQQDMPAGGYLGKEEFLNLLVTQLSFQDPLNPMDSTESIAQLAQFSALEQMQNVNTQIEALRQSTGMTDALFLQGQAVEATTSNGVQHAGLIEGATWSQNGLVLQINGAMVPLSTLTELRLMTPSTEEETAQDLTSDLTEVADNAIETQAPNATN